MLVILLIILVVMLIGALPKWNHSRNWSYFPSIGIGILIAILLFFVFLGRADI